MLSTPLACHAPATQTALAETAPRHELQGLFDQLEAELTDVNFWRVEAKKEGMWRNIRAVLTRAQLSSQEVATWRGMVRALAQKK